MLLKKKTKNHWLAQVLAVSRITFFIYAMEIIFFAYLAVVLFNQYYYYYMRACAVGFSFFTQKIN